jgi:UDP-glucose 6-dehydrogenase
VPDEYKVMIDKSTVPVGTAEKVRDAILAASPDPDAYQNVLMLSATLNSFAKVWPWMIL